MVTTVWRTMFFGTSTCSSERPKTPASDSCTVGSLSASAGSGFAGVVLLDRMLHRRLALAGEPAVCAAGCGFGSLCLRP